MEIDLTYWFKKDYIRLREIKKRDGVYTEILSKSIIFSLLYLSVNKILFTVYSLHFDPYKNRSLWKANIEFKDYQISSLKEESVM